MSRVRFTHAERRGMVAIDAVGSPRLHSHGCFRFKWIIRLLSHRPHERSSVAPAPLLSRLSFLRNDEELLRHVKW
jgi:hypothetical protein